MDRFSKYNQIKMEETNKEKATFITPLGTFCYKIMPFGLKNVEAIYQRSMVMFFHDMIHKEVKVYIDDVIIKSKGKENHTKILRKLFKRLWEFKFHLNLAKCTFKMTSRKLLQVVVSN